MTNKIENENIMFVENVEDLNEEVKSLALNLAIYLAKTKSSSEQLSQMEPDFIKLVNGTVKVVHELTMIINAARNKETMTYDVPSGKLKSDQIESKLHSILSQCQQIHDTLEEKSKKDA